jgi:hypothetical protein
MELSWSKEGTLKFGVHLKPNQQLKYLNAGSAHTPGCFWQDLHDDDKTCMQLSYWELILENGQ